MMRDAGQQFADRLAEVNALYNCDGYFLLKATVDHAGRADLAALRAGLEALGGTFAPATTWAAYFGPNRHDGVQTWRPLSYQTGCTCFVYSGGQQPFSHLAGQPR
jgi:hypothetical protein